jgi:hypothetical protein
MKLKKNKQMHTYLFKGFNLFMIAAFLNLTLSCHHYFKVNTVEDLTAYYSKEQLQKYQNLNKSFVLHSGENDYHITIIKVDATKKTMECKLDSSKWNNYTYDPFIKTNKVYSPKLGQEAVLNEVHIIASRVTVTNEKTITIPLSSISRIDIIEPDHGKTVASYVFPIVLIPAAVLALITIILILTKSSCPFVYAYDGQSYLFKGEIYGGAIFKPLERDDYMQMKAIGPDERELKLRLTNELLERQYTNLFKTVLVEHDLNTKVFIDNVGKIHTASNLQTPQTAVLNNQINYRQALSAVDSSYCLFDMETKNHNVNDLVLSFKKPVSPSQSKLILHAKNSLWLDFAFTEFTKLFGSFYNTYVEKQRTANRDTLVNWTVKQNLPLTVYVKQNNQWKLVNHIPTVGPLAARDFCVPIDLSEIKTADVEVKISCGFLFWEVDYAAMDFTKDAVTTSTELVLKSATDETGTDVSKLIAKTDELYLVQPEPGNSVNFTYNLPPLKEDKAYDVFLHTRGYYEHVRKYEGLPNKDYLLSMKNEGAFIDFTKVLYDEIIKNSELTALK